MYLLKHRAFFSSSLRKCVCVSSIENNRKVRWLFCVYIVGRASAYIVLNYPNICLLPCYRVRSWLTIYEEWRRSSSYHSMPLRMLKSFKLCTAIIRRTHANFWIYIRLIEFYISQSSASWARAHLPFFNCMTCLVMGEGVMQSASSRLPNSAT